MIRKKNQRFFSGITGYILVTSGKLYMIDYSWSKTIYWTTCFFYLGIKEIFFKDQNQVAKPTVSHLHVVDHTTDKAHNKIVLMCKLH